MMLTRCVAAAVLSAALTTSAFAATYTEPVNGDLSGNRATPTAFNLTTGANLLTATTGGGDLDVVRINVPAGNNLAQLILRAYTAQSFDSTAFVAIQQGSTFTVDPNTAGPTDLYGYTHISPFFINQDILPPMGTGFDAIGFTPPLASGNYSLFLQQLGTPVTYTMDFVVRAVPEPSTMILGGVGLAFLFVAARRKSR